MSAADVVAAVDAAQLAAFDQPQFAAASAASAFAAVVFAAQYAAVLAVSDEDAAVSALAVPDVPSSAAFLQDAAALAPDVW